MAQLLDEAALDPPHGVTPHFTTESNDQKWFYVAAVFCTVVPGVLFIMRLYTRLRIIRKMDATDYVSILGFLFFFAMVAVGKKLFLAGAGVHQWNLKRRDLNNILYYINIQNILYCPTIFCVKLAILLQYITLLAPNRTVNPFLSIGSRILIVLSAIYYIISLCVSTWACNPREKIWNDLLPGKCLNNNTMILITCLWNIASDIIILLLPARSVWKLRIPTKKRIAIVLLFATGLLACVTNAFIIMYLLRMSPADADASYNMAWLGLWVSAEISLGLCVISLLSLPKFMEAKGKRWLASFVKPFSSFGSSVSSKSKSMSWSRYSTRHTKTERSQNDSVHGTSLPRIHMGQGLSEMQLTSIAVSPTKTSTNASRDGTSINSSEAGRAMSDEYAHREYHTQEYR
jgi:hypothetical protein